MNKYIDCAICGSEAKWIEQDGSQHTYKCFHCLALNLRYEYDNETEEEIIVDKIEVLRLQETEKITTNKYIGHFELSFRCRKGDLYIIQGSFDFEVNDNEITINKLKDMDLSELVDKNFNEYNFINLNKDKDFKNITTNEIKKELKI